MPQLHTKFTGLRLTTVLVKFILLPAVEQMEELTAGAVLCGTARMPDPMLVPTMSATAPATLPLFVPPVDDAAPTTSCRGDDACSPSSIPGPPLALATTARALSPGAKLHRLPPRQLKLEDTRGAGQLEGTWRWNLAGQFVRLMTTPCIRGELSGSEWLDDGLRRQMGMADSIW
jgi:hypothetical protein